ncbi:MAG: dihydroneopterin aldolase [Acidimicrobiales bacterium]|mgnify:CR=1 FL=1|nr:dihydroneopterin aldolase [Acidimicrobiales bacterium]MDP6902753.1 dihydroneopterin aldolase [Acidimicrobiales bacterium]HJL99961.1 dihydroneopterin aldolase [Acidimicrobiales bacterium]
MKQQSDSDCIQLRGLRVVCIVGVLPEERERPQPIELDIDIYTDLSAAGKSDDLADTVDYGAVAETATEICLSSQAQLLEHLAQRIADQLLLLTPVSAVDITIKKIRPPIPMDINFTAVQVVRHTNE